MQDASTGPQLMARAVIGSHTGEEHEDHSNTLLNGTDYLTLSETLQKVSQRNQMQQELGFDYKQCLRLNL